MKTTREMKLNNWSSKKKYTYGYIFSSRNVHQM